MVLGIHVEGNTGHPREEAQKAAVWTEAACAVVVNDAILAKRLLDQDVRVFYRKKTADFDDDNLHQHVEARAAVQVLHVEAPEGAILYFNNEPGQWDLPLLVQHTLDALDEAEKLGRKLCILNWAYGNPEPAVWAALDGVLRRAVAGGHWIGVHEGWDTTDPAETAFPWKIGRFFGVQDKYGGNWVVTELTWSKNAYEGFSPTLSIPEYAKRLRWAAQLFAARGVFTCIFTLFPWQSGFDYFDKFELQDAMKVINREFPVQKGEPMATYRMIDYICPTGGPMYRLIGIGDEACQCVEVAGGYRRQLKNELYEELYDDGKFVYRGVDTSSRRFDEIYAQYDPTTGLYGAPWCPSSWDGKPFYRKPHVKHFRLNGYVFQSGVVGSWLRIKQYHAFWTSKSGRVVPDVLELQWGFSDNFSGVQESYFYAKGIGLVGFSDAGGQNSYIAKEPPVYIPASWEPSFSFGRPVTPPKGTTMPDRATLGTPQAGYIVKTQAIDANIRSLPSTSGGVVGTVRVGSQVSYRPAPVRAEGYDWYALEQPFGWLASVATISPNAPVKPLKQLTVPYVSQSSLEATKRNDCGPACWVMQHRNKQRAYGKTVIYPTVDDVSRHTPLWTNDVGTTADQIRTVSVGYGVDIEIKRDLRRDAVIALIDRGIPPTLLGLYSQLNPKDSFDGNHWFLVVGYGEAGFWIHDPYNLGEFAYITFGQFDAACSPFGYQGWILP